MTVGHKCRRMTFSHPSVHDSLTVKPVLLPSSSSQRAFWLASSTRARRFCHCGKVHQEVLVNTDLGSVRCEQPSQSSHNTRTQTVKGI
jgi:hypothetical protein